MTSPLQQIVTSIQQNDYVNLAIITAIGYDYILTFPKEIEYIWTQPWTQVSTLFILARYCGLCASISGSMFGNTLFPGPDKMYVFVLCPILLNMPKGLNTAGQVVYGLSEWNFCIFIGAAELVMILRVWALYNRSMLVLYILLTIYALEEMTFFACNVLLDTRLGSSAILIDQVLQFSFCVQTTYSTQDWLTYSTTGFGLTLGVLMCLLTTIQLIKELLQTYRVTKRVELNRYMICLAREGMVYFVVLVVAMAITILFDATLDTIDGLWLFLSNCVLQSVLPVVLVPRFILNLRELHAYNLRGRQGSNIDTGFGLGSGFEQGAVRSAIAFADPREDENEERGDEMEMEIREVARIGGVA